MTNDTISPVTRKIVAACDSIDCSLAGFIEARKSVSDFGEYESTFEALNLFNLVVRQIEGVLVLAREDLVLLPAAFTCARAAFETAAKAAWMVDADDAFEREIRWLAHVQEEERAYERTAKRAGSDGQKFSERAASIRKFRLAVASKLPEGVTELKRNPPMDKLLASLDAEHLYVLYIYLSQFAHGGHVATWLYREGGLGIERKAGEFILPSDWHLPLRICWLSLIELGSRLLWRLGLEKTPFLDSTRVEQIESIIDDVKTDKGSQVH